MRRLRGLSRGGRLVLALAVGGAVFGIATAVQASIPDANGVIHGCYAKAGTPSQGDLRVSDSGICKPTENPLSWSAKGVSGATGPTGPTGPVGPSTLLTNYTSSQSFSNTAFTAVATLTLPTGSYALSGIVAEFGPNVATTYDDVQCFLAETGGTATLHKVVASTVLHSDTDFATLPVNGDITVTSGPTTVNIDCDASVATEASTVSLLAQQVGTISAQ
jgi:hypothetical protein